MKREEKRYRVCRKGFVGTAGSRPSIFIELKFHPLEHECPSEILTRQTVLAHVTQGEVTDMEDQCENRGEEFGLYYSRKEKSLMENSGMCITAQPT